MGSITARVVNPQALSATVNALSKIYWYKEDFRRYLEACMSDDERMILGRFDWQLTKRAVASGLVNYLSRDIDRHGDCLMRLIENTASIDDFNHFNGLEDAEKKKEQAKGAVLELRRYAPKMVKPQEVKYAEKATKILEPETAELKKQYFEILKDPPAKRGYGLEKLLRELFVLYDLDPKASFKLAGHQIDGAFSWDSTEFLLEAKWEKVVADFSEIASFDAKIDTKLDNTLGLMLSINGFSSEAIGLYSQKKKKIIFMDGADLMLVLDSRVKFDMLLRQKKQAASRRGVLFLKAQELI